MSNIAETVLCINDLVMTGLLYISEARCTYNLYVDDDNLIGVN